MPWLQTYDPLHNAFLSTAVAAIPIVVLLGLIAWGHIAIHRAAFVTLLLAIGVATLGYGMPLKSACMAGVYGAAYGLLPIGWMIVNIIFLHRLTVEKGWFEDLKGQLLHLAPDPRIQVILIAFCFGAFFEGTAGFGAPVAVTAALLMQLGFAPLQACVLSLIANTAPVAFGSLGTPIIALHNVTGIDEMLLSQMTGRQLPIFSVIIPFWVVAAYVGWRGMLGVWPVALTAGLSFAIPQFLVSNFIGPHLVDIISALCSIAAVVVLLRLWKPKDAAAVKSSDPLPGAVPATSAWLKFRPWLPWLILSVTVFIWAQKPVKDWLDSQFSRSVPVQGLHQMVQRTPPVAPVPTPEAPAKPEDALFKVNVLSTVGTGILLAATIAGLCMGFSPLRLLQLYGSTLYKLRLSLLTIACMLALGNITKYSGADATLGLALAQTGWMYPFFSAMLGWLGVALTGSDTASNVLFGSLQTITAQQVGVSPILLASANTTGGVMGKMIDAQSIVVASTATNWHGHEGSILRAVFWHSIVLASLVGILVFLQAYVWPFSEMVVK